jgi:hypothetical protein
MSDLFFNSAQGYGNCKITRLVEDSNRGGTFTNDYHGFALGPTGTNDISFTCEVPDDWDSTKDPTIQVFGYTNGTGTSQNYRFELGLTYKKSGEIASASEAEVITWTEPAPDADNTFLLTTAKQANRLNIEAGDNMRITFKRLGGDPLDTRGGNFTFINCQITFARKGFGLSS